MNNDTENSNFLKARELFLQSIDLQQNGKPIEAKKNLEEAFKLYPSRESTINNLVILYFRFQEFENLKVLLSKIDQSGHIYKVGNLYLDYLNGDFNKCLKLSSELLTSLDDKDIRKSQLIDLMINCYFQVGDIANIFLYCRKILKDKSFYDQKLFLVGNFLILLSKPRAAKWYIQKSLKINFNKTYLNYLGFCMLQLKDFKNGLPYWKERFDVPQSGFELFYEIPKLSSMQQASKKKIVVWYEQGIGDTINFSRFVIYLKKFTPDIFFVVQDSLVEIFRSFYKDIQIISNQKATNMSFDYQISLTGLMNLLDLNYEDIGCEIINGNKAIINNTKPIKKIGFAYAGNPKYFRDKYRSMNIEKFRNIFSISSIEYFKLNNQIDPEIKQYKNVNDLGDLSIFEIAKKLPQFDLVISTDTFLVHLCGLLNINCILLLNYNADWRWFEDRKYTKWYPSVRIFKQKKILNWEDVIKTMVRFLRKKSKINLSQ